MSIMNQDFNQQQYNDKLAQVASLAVTYAKDGTGYHSMKDAFNELCEISHANKGIDQENTIGRRTLLVQSVCIKAIHALTPYQNCLLYTSPSPRDVEESRMPSSA